MDHLWDFVLFIGTDFWAAIPPIGWWPIPVAAIVGFSVGYVLRRSIWVLHVWPWDDSSTAMKAGTGAGFLFGIISVQIRPFLFDLSLSDLARFALFLAFVSFLAALFSSAVASNMQQKKLYRLDDKSFANMDEIYVLGHSFKRMTAEEKKNYNYWFSPDVFLYKVPRSERVIIYEPTFGIIKDSSGPTPKHWLASK